MKRQAKARRIECQTMLSVLSTQQMTYLRKNGFTFNSILCPFTGIGVNLVEIPAVGWKDSLTLPKSESANFCSPSLTETVGSVAYPLRLSQSPSVAYQYAYKAAPWNTCAPDGIGGCSSVTGNVGVGDSIPTGGGGTNVHGFTAPSGTVASIGGLNGLINSDGTLENPGPHDYTKFIVFCRGNIDSDVSEDLVGLDQLGNTAIFKDDVND